MLQHVEEVHKNNPFICSICKEKYIFKKVIYAHMKCAHVNKKSVYKYMCAKCGKGFDNKAHYQIHADHHNDMKCYSCGKCNYPCYSTSQLNLHVTSCIDGISHEFSIGGKEFLQKQYLKNHFMNEHLNNSYKICSVIYVSGRTSTKTLTRDIWSKSTNLNCLHRNFKFMCECK